MASNSPTILLLLLVACISSVHLQADDSVQWRLPTTLIPNTYRLHINLTEAALSPDSDEYRGMVIITITSSVTTNTIQLHSSYDHIVLDLVTLSNTDIDESQYSVNNLTDILTINTPFQLNPGITYPLIIEFTGYLSTTEMTGFYKSSYVNPEGVTRYLATTQFQPTSARRAFPCFDEPFFKATFEIYITYPFGYNALSNSPGDLYTNDSVSETYRFNDTAVMSTYLIAFIISDFTCTEGASIDNVPYQICSRNESADIRDWALEIGPPIMDGLNEYTDFNYNLSKPKLDQVAIPDFAAGAMENWGLVTYRELFLLWDPNESTNNLKQLVATINSHEFAHFWFGNLVTCEWWDVTFLNEGFATYFEYFATHFALPEWELDKQYVVDVVQPIFVTDALETALALESEANTPTEVMAKFGGISYSKGGAVFRMVEHIMGSDNFRDALRIYLERYQYSTVRPENLWATLQGSIDNATSQLPANSNLTQVMHNWVNYPGFPVLTVTVRGTRVTITQERFLLSGEDTDTKWYVPITYTTSEDQNKFASTSPSSWLTPTEDVAFDLAVTGATWVIVNNQQTGYYRVNYDTASWNCIRDALYREDFDGITEINRAQIVDDLFNLARVDKVPYSQVLNIVQYLVNETSYYPWVPAISGFNFLLNRVGLESPLGQALAQHVLKLMEKLYADVSFFPNEDDAHIDIHKQVLALGTACRLGQVSCIARAETFFFTFKNHGLRPPRNLRNIVYCNTLRHSNDPDDWEFLWNVYTNSTLASDTQVIIPALGCSRDEEILERYLELSVTEGSGIRSQDRLSVFNAVLNGNPIGINVAFEFLTKNHDRINEMYLSMNALPNLLNNIAARFTTKEEVERLKEFIDAGGLPEVYLPSARSALEAAESNIEWLDYFFEHLFNFFFRVGTSAAPEVFSLHLGVALLFVFIAQLF